jgi:hypothetical protein
MLAHRRARICILGAAALLLAAAAAWGQAPPGSGSPAETPEGSSAITDEAAPGAVEATPRQVETEPSWSEAVDALADGTVPVSDYVDPRLGVLWVRYLEEGGAEGSGETHSAERLCGADLTAAQDRIRSFFVEMARRGEEEGLQCDLHQCRAGGMEYEPALYALFARDAAGRPRLEALLEKSEALLDDAWFEQMDAYVRPQVQAYRESACPGEATDPPGTTP